MLIPPTHDELVSLAAEWAKKRYPLVVTELTCATSEQADVIAFRVGSSLVIECKVSRSDFLSDKKKPFRRNPGRGMGYLRMYCAPEGLIAPHELPDRWGLLELKPKGLRQTVRVHMNRNQGYADGSHTFIERNLKAENTVLLSVIRRIGRGSDNGVSVKMYTHETKNRASVHIDVSTPTH